MAIVVVVQLAFTYAPPMQAVFHTRDISWQAWGAIVLVASSVYFLVEAEKWVFRVRQASSGRS